MSDEQATKPRVDPELALARKAKRLGMSKREFINRRTSSIEESAKEHRWRLSETAATIANLHEIANDVWTVLKVKFEKVPGGGGEYIAAAHGHSFSATPARYGLRIDRDGVFMTIQETIERANIWLNSERAEKGRIDGTN